MPIKPDMLRIASINLISLTTVNGALYGFCFALYCLCARSLYLQLRDNDQPKQKIMTLAHMSLVMALGLINLSVDAHGIQLSYVNHADYSSGGGFGYGATVYDSQPISFVCSGLLILNDVLLLGIEIWRVWVVWSSSKYAPYVVLAPVLGLLAYIAGDVALLVYLVTRVFEPTVWLSLAIESLLLFIHLNVTLSIIARVILVRQRYVKITDALHGSTHSMTGSHYTDIITMLVESFALVSAWTATEIAVLGLSEVGDIRGSLPVSLFFTGSEPYIRIIAYLLLLYRVTAGRAWRRDTERQLTTIRVDIRRSKTTDETSSIQKNHYLQSA